LSISGFRRGRSTDGRSHLSVAHILLSVALVGCVFALVALGVWQIERRSWKLALIDQVDARIHAPPGPMPSTSSWPTISAADDAYRSWKSGSIQKLDAAPTTLADGVRTGDFRAGLDVEVVYRFIRDTVWVAVRWYRPGGSLSARAVADEYLAILLDGIAGRGQSTPPLDR